MEHLNLAIADLVGSASFILTAFALLVTGLAVAVTTWANYRARKHEAEVARIELSYRLLLAAAGAGDARLPAQSTHYSSVPVQVMALAALRSFPEFTGVYERLLEDRERQAKTHPDEWNAVLLAATNRLVEDVRGDLRNK